CRPRPFDQEATDFVYVKHRVLQPESGAFNLISPCHEYKSFLTAATLDRTRLQAKFAREVLKFAIGCMNIRSNGTIHFGVADSKESTDYTHGEIIGIPVEEKDIYVDTLNYIERCVPTDSSHVHQCVRSPRFIEVMDQKGTEKSFVVEVDVVPSLSIVKNKVYAVRLPNFKESTNKVEFEKKQVLRRVGASTNPVLEEGLKHVCDIEKNPEKAIQLLEEAFQQFREDAFIAQTLARLHYTYKMFEQAEHWAETATKKQPNNSCLLDTKGQVYKKWFQ
ncbi:unnamed protein product, partial [Tetraodon nigroviridis]